MSINCDCEYGGCGVNAAGEPVVVTCRTARECGSCGDPISPGELMYRYNLYDYDQFRTAGFFWMCESCGDLAESIKELGYCYDLTDVKGQWQEYLEAGQ